METFLYIVFFVSCIVLVLSVLLQPGKTDAGALFTSGVSSAALNPRGTASVLSKLTIAAATVFMLSALFLSLPALTGNVSVLQTQGEKNNSTGAANTDANANTANTADANAANTSSGESNSNTASNAETKTDDAKADDKAEAEDEKKSDAKEEPKADEKKAEDKKDDSQ